MIIGLTGKAGSGKDTAADIAIDLLTKHGINAKKIACAEPIKRLCIEVICTAYDIPESTFIGGQEDKRQPIPELNNWTGREIMQYIGTDCFHHIANDIWAKYAISTAKELLDQEFDVIFISDVRFLAEARAIKQENGTLIRLNRSSSQKRDYHVSEQEYSSIEADYTIENQGNSKEELTYHMENILCRLDFLPST